MDRREALKRTFLLTGYALSAGTVSAVMQGCKADTTLSGDWTPAFLTQDQALLVAEIAETILPRTEDSPGAKDVNVHQFIDLMLKDYVSEAEQEMYRKGMDAFAANCKEVNDGRSFLELSPEQRLEYLTTVDKQAMATEGKRDESAPEHLRFYVVLKQSVIAGYFTSETVGTEVLAYDPIPGEFVNCSPVEEISGGRVWSLQ